MIPTMGIFSRMKRAIKSKANDAINKAINPAKELEMAILQLEEQRKQAYKELLAYKTSAKQMEQDIARLEEKAREWERKAAIAVKSGDDELAKKCLREKQEAEAEIVRIRSDRDEAAGHAAQLNRSRKQLETRLRVLQLRKGTMATQIAAARSGTGNVFGHKSDPFEKLERAQAAIDDEALAAEVQGEINDQAEARKLEQEIDAAAHASGGIAPPDADDALTQLKAKMEAEKKKLPPAK
jgi:phage shock protein A